MIGHTEQRALHKTFGEVAHHISSALSTLSLPMSCAFLFLPVRLPCPRVRLFGEEFPEAMWMPSFFRLVKVVEGAVALAVYG